MSLGMCTYAAVKSQNQMLKRTFFYKFPSNTNVRLSTVWLWHNDFVCTTYRSLLPCYRAYSGPAGYSVVFLWADTDPFLFFAVMVLDLSVKGMLWWYSFD